MGKSQNVFGDFIDDYEEPKDDSIEPITQVDVFESIATMPIEPCLSNGKCEHYENCLDNALACIRFMHYCSKGEILPTTSKRDVCTPTKEIFKAIFPNDDEGVEVYGMQQDEI